MLIELQHERDAGSGGLHDICICILCKLDNKFPIYLHVLTRHVSMFHILQSPDRNDKNGQRLNIKLN